MQSISTFSNFLDTGNSFTVKFVNQTTQISDWILSCSLVKCSTRNLEVLGASCTGSSVSFVGVSLGKTLYSPSA